MDQLLSPKQVARAIGASEASLKRWCDKGLLPAVRTIGGHRRLPISGVLRFIRERGHALVRPEVLGMPATTGSGSGILERARDRIRIALEDGDEDRFRASAFDLYLGGRSVCEIGDRILMPVFDSIGHRWRRGTLEVYQERRAVEICTRWLHEMRAAMPPVSEQGPHAIGGTLAGDPYTLPTSLVELALREAGWRSTLR